MGSIVVLRGRVIWTILPKVIVSVQTALVSISSIWRRFFWLLVAGWFFFNLDIPMCLLDCLQDCLGRLQGLGLVPFFQKVVPFPLFCREG